MDKDLEEFIDQVARQRGLTKKTSERLLLDLINKPQKLNQMMQILASVSEVFGVCQQCFGLTKNNKCLTCEDPRRNQNVICVVATLDDLLNIEKHQQFNGLYAVLQGEIKLNKNLGPEQLKIANLISRAAAAEEIILALNNTFEGEVTANYLAKSLARLSDLKVTRLAKGLPTGGMLDYIDENTLLSALENRKKVEK